MLYVRRLIWFIASRMLLVCVLVGMLVCGFFMAMNGANIYVVLNEGMEKRVDVILTRQQAEELNKYFHADFLIADEALEGALNGMDNLTHVNGMAVPVFNSVAAGAVSSGGFTAIAIDPSTQTGTVTFRVKTAPAVDTPEGDWTAVDVTGITTDATAIHVPVPADSPAGFFKVVPD